MPQLSVFPSTLYDTLPFATQYWDSSYVDLVLDQSLGVKLTHISTLYSSNSARCMDFPPFRFVNNVAISEGQIIVSPGSSGRLCRNWTTLIDALRDSMVVGASTDVSRPVSLLIRCRPSKIPEEETILPLAPKSLTYT